jgi:oligopeptidase A
MKNPFDPVAAFPDFAAMTPEAADEALPKLLADAEKAVDALEKTALPTWDGLIRPLEEAVQPLWRAWGCVSHLLSVANSEGWRRIQEKYQAQMVAFSLRTGQSKRFYELAKKTPAETPSRKRILAKMVQQAELAGVALEGAKQARFNAIQTELAACANDFRNHVLDATKAFSLVLTNPVEVEGLPDSLKALLAGENDPQVGPWTATIEDAVYVPFMKDARNRSAREALFRARATRASGGGADNTPLVSKILTLRQELAALLGYAHYADLSLAEKSAPSVAAVDAMLTELAQASKPAARREEDELAAFAAKEGFDQPLQPWDRAFWAERQREKKYAYSEEELSRYFNLPTVLDGLFALAKRLFDVEITPAEPVPTWHPDVRVYRVCAATGETRAYFYFDPYSRPETKSGGAWMNEFTTRARKADGSWDLPLAVICCNQTLPTADGRALMRFSEVETLFHEFGHALQHMLTTEEDAGSSGLNLIEWDAVEVASQFMENWCTDAVTLQRFARHVETGAAIPPDLLARVRAAKNYRAGAASVRQLAFATLDLRLHVAPPADPNELKNTLFEAFMPGTTVPEDRFLNSFSHIFAGGYAAGYYGYKWSEVMSADVFAAFEEAGLSDEEAVRRTGRLFRDTFLARGGGLSPMEVFRLFRGRAPSTDALLRQTGLRG